MAVSIFSVLHYSHGRDSPVDPPRCPIEFFCDPLREDYIYSCPWSEDIDGTTQSAAIW